MKISKTLCLFILIIFLIFFGTLSNFNIYISLVLSGVAAFLIAIEAKDGDYMVCFGILLLLVFQNLCIGFGAHLFSNRNSDLIYLTQIPTLVVLIIWICLQLKKMQIKNNKKIESKKWFIGILLCIMFSYAISHGNFNSIISTIRNITFFYMVYEISITYINDETKLKKFYILFRKLIIFLFFIGIIFYIVGYDMYEFFGINEVLIAKGSQVLNGSLSRRYVTNIFSFFVPRLSSLYFEPVNLSYVFAISLILNIYYDERNLNQKIGDIIISFLGLLLTFGKGGYLLFLLVVLYDFGTKFGKKLNSSFRTIVVVIILIVVVVFFMELYLSKYTKSFALPHIWSIQNTFNSILKKPIGYGLGKGGNAARIFDSIDGDYLSSGGESAIMAFTYQIGIQGLLCLFLCFKNLFPFKNAANDKFVKILQILPFIIFAVAIFQENTFTPQCITIYMIVIGALYSINYKKMGGLHESDKS